MVGSRARGPAGLALAPDGGGIVGTKGTTQSSPRPRTGPVLTGPVLTVLVLVLAVIAAGYMGQLSAEPVVDPSVAGLEQQDPSATATPEALPDDGERLVISGDTAAGALLLLVMTVLALLLRFLLRFLPRSRFQQVDGFLDRTELQRPGTSLLADALPAWAEASRAALAASTDTSDAVIRCWLDFERLCAAAGAGRRPAQTTTDFAVAVSSALALPPQPLSTLNRLYQRARFGQATHDRSPGLLPADREPADRERADRELADRELAAASIDELSAALASRGSQRGDGTTP
ncbi:DUF4129 domain-containing protein [Arthrobacter sedimenti]|uniref:DUF4129 domain-containing protein n=1 Tax=Arthrobacter sedimenti TaxID=2694931 RepID=UPI001422425B|nr:DUF4129 domain-containing protein [Arthrobacter sedimenti]